MHSIKEKYNKTVVPEMKKKLGYKTILAVPRIIKIVVSAGVGPKKDDKEKMAAVEKSLTSIAGQKVKINKAKKSIATFKLREGMVIGYSVTLRGQRMYNFLDKIINIAIPRVRDFRGFSTDLIDNTGSLTVGFKEHVVFPEAGGEDVRSAFGLGVTIVTNAKTKEEALELFKLIGFPFKK